MASIEALKSMSKEELVQKAHSTAQRAVATYRKHQAMIKHVGMSVAGDAAAVGTGLFCGALELKLPRLPKTQLRTDLLAAGGLSLINLTNVMGEATPIFQAAAHAFTGHGMGRVSEKFLLSKGVTRAKSEAKAAD